MKTVREQLINKSGNTLRYIGDKDTGMIFQVLRNNRKHHKIFVPLLNDLETSVLNCTHYDYEV